MTQAEQEIKFSSILPTFADYWTMRMEASAVGPCLLMAE